MRRRKAVSEIVASLILMLIVSVLGAAIYNYTLQVNQIQQNKILNDYSVSSGRAQERFRATAAWWSGSGTAITLTILNYGLNELSISDVYVNGQNVSTWTSGRLTTISIGKLQAVNFNSPVAIITGATYQITVVSQRGVTVAYTWKP
jgi:flagellin-like protein